MEAARASEGGFSPLETTSTISVKTRSKKPLEPGTAPAPRMSDETIKRLTGVFKLLSDKSRLKIVLALAEDGEMHVSALCAMLGQSQPAVSHHLTLMRTVGLIDFDRQGKHNYYHLAGDFVRNLMELFFVESGTEQRALQFEDFALSFRRK
jgi:ArsR family transcriptional regulator